MIGSANENTSLNISFPIVSQVKSEAITMTTQQPNTTGGQAAPVVVRTIDPYTLFPSPTNNFLMQSVGTAEELKCLFCFPIESTFQVLRVCLGILIGLSAVGILVLTIDIFAGDVNYGIGAGSIWILTVSLMVGYLILKVYTFYRCHQFIQLSRNGTVEFHDTGRKFFYAFGVYIFLSFFLLFLFWSECMRWFTLIQVATFFGLQKKKKQGGAGS